MGVPLIIIVFFLVIWVITNVVRAQQEDAKSYKRNANNPRRNIGESKPIQQNSLNDIERFRQEIDRLRRKSTDAPAAPRPATAAAPRPQAPALRPKPLPPKKATRPTAARRVEPPAKPQPAPKPFQMPQQPVPLEETAVTPVTPPPEITVSPGISTAILGKNAQHKAANREFLANLGAVLSSGGGPRMAIILTEIFGPPKSARKPG